MESCPLHHDRMHCPTILWRRNWRRSALVWLAALLISLATVDRDVAADEMEYYRLAAQQPGTETFALGVGIASLVKLIVLPHSSVDLDVMITSGFLENFAKINQSDTHFALLKTNWQDLSGEATENINIASSPLQHCITMMISRQSWSLETMLINALFTKLRRPFSRIYLT